MRRSRIVFCLGFFAFLFPPPALADSTDSALPVTTASAVPDSTLILYPEKGPGIEVDYIGYWSMGTLRFRKVSGEVGYLSANRIRSIEDKEGNDRLGAMVRKKSSFGVFDPDAKPRSYTAWITRPFRQTPERRRRSYFVIELGGANRASEVRYSRDDGSLFLTGIGGIRNLSPRWGIGGIVQFTSTSDDYSTIALGVRVRRYLSDVFTVETTHGLYDDIDDGFDNRGGIPYFGEVALSVAGAISFFSRVEHHQVRAYRSSIDSDGIYHSEWIDVTDTAIHFGIRFGPRPGYLIAPIAALASLAVLAPLGNHY